MPSDPSAAAISSRVCFASVATPRYQRFMPSKQLHVQEGELATDHVEDRLDRVAVQSALHGSSCA